MFILWNCLCVYFNLSNILWNIFIHLDFQLYEHYKKNQNLKPLNNIRFYFLLNFWVLLLSILNLGWCFSCLTTGSWTGWSLEAFSSSKICDATCCVGRSCCFGQCVGEFCCSLNIYPKNVLGLRRFWDYNSNDSFLISRNPNITTNRSTK